MKINVLKPVLYQSYGINNSSADFSLKKNYETPVSPNFPRTNIISFTSNIKNIGLPAKNYNLNGKSILITGGTGSLGTALVKELIENYSPKEILVYSRDEYKQFHMKRKMPKNAPVKFVIGDIRDENALRAAMKKADVVIHTAAMKHVAICDENKEEAVKSNFFGTLNVINAAEESNVQRLILISTDKAANASNFYGQTKRMAENLFKNANKFSNGDRLFSVIRMGNILGSRGSVLPLFNEQKKNGELTVTDKAMTRFFITPKQAAKQVLSSIEIMRGGEIFIPKLKSTNIMTLAKETAPDCSIKIIGAGSSEKIHEDLISDGERKHTYELSDRYVILPQTKTLDSAKPLPDDFSYTSSDKKTQFSLDELRSIIKECSEN